MITRLSEDLQQTLLLIASGYSDKEVARRQFISVRGVQNRIRSLFNQICDFKYNVNEGDHYHVYNIRCLVVATALRKGYLKIESLGCYERGEEMLQKELLAQEKRNAAAQAVAEMHRKIAELIA